ncbi:energy transducer TonB [Kineobactrum salinum]|uniref:Energy transducer TonB n=1 Tax=Kineobactrum salinum TaxID=2708301 RepID=A0A6C0U0I9_9GAMM|nr:energy transducer TonB [Kineobactrum salinum]QIB65526.1 energy transducer TonB [Kineobactrum salinum]
MQQSIVSEEPENRFGIAVFLATALHVILVLGLGFEIGNQPPPGPQLEITLARQPSGAVPEEARHLAQFNQQGSGDLSDRTSVSSASAMPQAAARQQARSAAETVQAQRAGQRPVTTRAQSRPLPAEAPDSASTSPAAVAGSSPEAQRLQGELATLEAILEEQAQDYSNRPRVRRLTSLSTREAVDARYLHAWRQRVEAVGNQYYPEASIRYGLYGSLRLLVVINADGQLEDIRILSSSGYAVLDEAAIKIVRMAAPYAPFPGALRATTDQLEIIRTWQFQENRLSSG